MLKQQHQQVVELKVPSFPISTFSYTTLPFTKLRAITLDFVINLINFKLTQACGALCPAWFLPLPGVTSSRYQNSQGVGTLEHGLV